MQGHDGSSMVAYLVVSRIATVTLPKVGCQHIRCWYNLLRGILPSVYMKHLRKILGISAQLLRHKS